MNFLKTFKKSWRRIFDYKGKSTRREFLEYFITYYIGRLILFLILLFIEPLQYIFLSNEDSLAGIFSSLLQVLFELLKLINAIYIFGGIFVAISLSIRSLRDAGARWQWVFLNFVNPIGCIFIYFFPLKRKKITK